MKARIAKKIVKNVWLFQPVFYTRRQVMQALIRVRMPLSMAWMVIAKHRILRFKPRDLSDHAWEKWAWEMSPGRREEFIAKARLAALNTTFTPPIGR